MFMAFLLLLPSFFYYIIAIGLLPNSYFIYSAFSLIAHLVTAKTIQTPIIILVAISLTHVLVYAFVYHWLSKLIASLIYKIQSQKMRVFVVSGIVVALVWASFLLPIYFTIGEGATGPTNIIGIFKTF